VHTSKPFSIHQSKLNIIRLRKVIKDLPPFCAEYFRGIEPHTSILTRINYGYDLRLFFQYLTSEVEEFCEKIPQDLTIQDLKRIEAVHLEMFLVVLASHPDISFSVSI
jgi:integrase/recombinase XerC